MNKKTYRVGAIGHSGAGNFGHQIHLAYRGLDINKFLGHDVFFGLWFLIMK